MTYALGSFQLGIVTSERVSTDAQLFEQPMPRSNAASTYLIDLFGVVKIITLGGVFVAGTGGLTIKQFIDQFIDDTTGAIRGNQSALSYTSDTFTTVLTSAVIIKNFDYTYEAGDPNKVNYTLSIQEGTII